METEATTYDFSDGFTIQVTTTYRTNDGLLFETLASAKAHIADLQMEKWYQEHELYGRSEGSKVPWDYFHSWAGDNMKPLYEWLSRVYRDSHENKLHPRD